MANLYQAISPAIHLVHAMSRAPILVQFRWLYATKDAELWYEALQLDVNKVWDFEAIARRLSALIVW